MNSSTNRSDEINFTSDPQATPSYGGIKGELPRYVLSNYLGSLENDRPRRKNLKRRDCEGMKLRPKMMTIASQ